MAETPGCFGMLEELRIDNLALIEALHLDFDGQASGLIVFTGETGAGKSIILQAVDLLTGRRASASWIRADRERAVIEAVFSLRPGQDDLHRLLRENDLDEGERIVLRRVIEKSGRSRFHCNDRQITSRLAGMLGDLLVNMASQHDHQQLLIPRNHLDFLDTFGEIVQARQAFASLFSAWRDLDEKLRVAREKERDKEQRRDFLHFQLREIREAAPLAGEDESLLRERELLKSSSSLHALAAASLHLLQPEVVGNLATIRKNMEQVVALDPGVRELADRCAAASYEAEDLAGVLLQYLENIPSDPSRLERISERLAQLRQLQRKYGPSIEDVLAQAAQAEQELALLESVEEQIAVLIKERNRLGEHLRDQAIALTSARKDAALILNGAMERELAGLCFPGAVFQATVTSPESWSVEKVQASGQDTVEFLFSANPGEPVKPLNRVASGGELSRLMLAMKCLLARRDQVDTIIFDEVDAGISGKAAEAVAGKIWQLAGHHQVFCITHLPQIAALGDLHYMVEKTASGQRTVSSISLLEEEQRVEELARMLGGSSLTEQTMGFARELASRHREGR